MDFLRLIRYKNLLMVLLTMFLTKYALIDSQIQPPSFSNFHFFLLSVSVSFITIGGYLINDIFDRILIKILIRIQKGMNILLFLMK